MNQFDPFGQGLNLLGSLEDEVVVELEELSRRFMNSLFVLIRSSWLYSLENDALKNAQDSFSLLLSEFIDRGQEVVELRLRDESFFLNGDIVKLDFSTYKSAQKLKKLFVLFQIDQVAFPLPTTVEQLSALSLVLSKVAHSNQKFADLTEECLPIIVAFQGHLDDEHHLNSKDPRVEVLRLYSHGLTVLRSFVEDLQRGLRPKYAKIKRLCIRLINLDTKYLNLMLAATHLSSVKGKLYTHMLNTAILCLVFGRRMKMSRMALVDLCMAAFYQNLSWALVNQVHSGASGVNLDTIQEIEAYRLRNRGTMKEIRNHIAHLLLMIGGFNTKIISRLIVAYETQLDSERESDALYVGDIDINFLTEIVRMASRYDHLTARTVQDRTGIRNDEVVQSILKKREHADDFALELFGSALGIYPIGSLVELNGGDLAIVFDLPSSIEHSNRPRVKLVSDRTGVYRSDGDVIDLSERDARGGYLRSIEHVLDASNFGLSVPHLFFGGIARERVR